MTDDRSGAPHPEVRSGGLLGTKLAVPLPRWRPVPRPRLLDLLDAGTRGPLTLLAAPAGAGKTVLLASWVAAGRPGGQVAWVTVDPGDDDPVRFWAHVVAALRDGGAVAGDGPLAGLDPSHGVDERFLVLLVNGLAELARPVVLVLDDLHEAAGAALATGLRFVLRHAPPQLRVVVATRVDPALSLHRLRVVGQLTEIRVAELAFTPTEAGELFTGLGVDLPDGELRSLWRRTEGWAAGLRLAAMSLHGHPDPVRFVAEFAGDDRAVAGYLVEEVLARQPTEAQEFLLRTCIAEQLCGGLADALTGRADGERMLARLERDHAFTTGLGPSRTWYRYHPLFAELLRAELRHGQPAEVPELNRRAAAWHAANGLVAEAVRHALAGGDVDGAAALLAAHWLAMVVDGRAATLRDLLGRLPVERVLTDRELAVVAAVARLALGELAEADAWLRLAEAAEPSRTRRPESEWAWSLAVLLRSRAYGDVEQARSAAAELLAPRRKGARARPVGEEDRQALVRCLLGAAELWGGRLDDAAAHLEEGRAAAGRTGRTCLALGATSHLALLEAVRGRLDRAALLAREAADLAGRRGCSAPPELACAELALAGVAYQRDDLGGALGTLERAARAASTGRDRPVGLAVALMEARLAASGTRQDAVHGLQRLRRALRDTGGWRPPPLLAAGVRLAEARLLLASGAETTAVALLHSGDGTQPGALPGAETTVLARLRLAKGDPAGAATTVAPVLGGQASPAPRTTTLIEARLVDAVAHRKLAHHDAAAGSLERALDLAAPEGFRRPFAEGGAPVRALLADHLHRGTAHAALAGELLEGLLGRVAAPSAPAEPAGGQPVVPALVEPLSEREQVVLRYLPSMLSAGEIADELYVSVNTVKTHIKSIYRKLDANRRWDAVRRARSLHLL
jgi:LuxR family transcriptional regulator, maltose regulon positive regulatory protein